MLSIKFNTSFERSTLCPEIQPGYSGFPEGRQCDFLYHYRKRYRYYRHSSL